jgi:hypothetical protein
MAKPIAPVLTTLLNDLFAAARRDRSAGDLQVLRIAGRELEDLSVVARADLEAMDAHYNGRLEVARGAALARLGASPAGRRVQRLTKGAR